MTQQTSMEFRPSVSMPSLYMPVNSMIPRWFSLTLSIAAPLAIIVGWAASMSAPIDHDASYVFSGLITIAAAVFGAMSVRRTLSTQPLLTALWLLFLVAYPLKLYVIAIQDVWSDETVQASVWQAGHTAGLLAAASSVVAYTFLSTSCVMFLFSRRARGTTLDDGSRWIESHRLLSGMCLVSAVALVASLLQWWYNMALVGAVQDTMPFRLTGWVVYLQTAFVPTFLLCLMYRAEAAKSRIYPGVALALLLGHAAVYQMLTASRGYVVCVVVLIGFYWLAKRELTSRRIAVAVAVFVSVSALSPLFTLVRYSRALEGVALSESIDRAQQSTTGSYFGDYLAAGLTHSFFRVTGSDGLLLAVRHPLEGSVGDNMKLLYNDPDRTSAVVFTQEFAGSFSFRTQYAPGLVAVFYIIGGTSFAAVGLAAALALAELGWVYFVGRPKSRYGPVAAALLGTTAVMVVMEGDLGNILVRAAAFSASLLFSRWFFGGSRSEFTWERKDVFVA